MAVRRASTESFAKVGEGTSISTLLSMSVPDFHKDAICAQTDPESFFPARGGSTREAKRVCIGSKTKEGCPARERCLKYALDNDERFGVWGGLSERERRKLKKQAA
jgi:hypothetical protein